MRVEVSVEIFFKNVFPSAVTPFFNHTMVNIAPLCTKVDPESFFSRCWVDLHGYDRRLAPSLTTSATRPSKRLEIDLLNGGVRR